MAGWAKVFLPWPEALLIHLRASKWREVSTPPKPEHMVWKHSWDLSQPPSKQKAKAQVDFHHAWGASKPMSSDPLHLWQQAWLDGTEQGGGPVSLECFPPHYPPGEQIPQPSLWYLPDVFFPPHPSCENLIKLLKLCASLSSSVSWEK